MDGMQALRSAIRSPRIRSAWPRAALAVTMALEQSTRRPPLASFLLQQLLA
jgi:hypothetical protein